MSDTKASSDKPETKSARPEAAPDQPLASGAEKAAPKVGTEPEQEGERTENPDALAARELETGSLMEKAGETAKRAAPLGLASLPEAPEEGAPAENGPEEETETPEEAEAAPEEEPARAPAFVSAWGRLFNAFANVGPFMLLAIMAIMVWPDFVNNGAATYCPAEAKRMSALMRCLAEGNWLTPIGLQDGAWTAAQWPGFIWFMALFKLIPLPHLDALLFPLAACASAALALLAVWWLAHSAGFGARASFAAGAILLCAPIFAPMPHFVGPASLATAFLLLAILFFGKGWQARRAWLRLSLAFAFTALAGMTGGLFFFITPLAASFILLLWQGRLHRAQALDALLGFVVMLIIIGLWQGALSLEESKTYLDMLWANPIHISWPLAPGWWLALLIAGLGLLPWLMEILGVSWFRVLGRSAKSLGASRRENGAALIWISLAIGCCLSLFMPNGQIMAVALACLAAPLLGKAFVNLSGAGESFFFFLCALFLIAAGLLVLGASLPSTQPWLVSFSPIKPGQKILEAMLAMNTLPILGGLTLAGGLFTLFFAKRGRQGGGLVYALLLAIILAQPALLMLVPELGARPEMKLLSEAAIARSVQGALKPAPEVIKVEPAPVDTTTQAPEPKQEPAPAAEPAAAPAQPAPEAASTQPANEAAPEAAAQAGQPAPETPGATAAPAGTALPEAAPAEKTPAAEANEKPAPAPETAAPVQEPAQAEAGAPESK